MPDRKSRPPAEEFRVPFGVPALDQMLEGGLMSRRPYLLAGPSGTGKTTLALQFLIEGIRRGERVLYVTLEDPPNEVRINHRSLGPELDQIDVFDAIPDVMRYERIPFKDISSVRDVVPFAAVLDGMRQTPEFTSVEVTIAALEQMLRTQVAHHGYSRLVIDSLTALQYFCMKGFEPVLGAQTFLRFLSDLRTTTLLTVESPLENSETPERMIARGEIRLFRWERDGFTLRAIGVEKLRGSPHDVRMHPYRIGSRGLDINVDVTLSRETREIPEPLVTLVPPGAESEAEPPTSTPRAITEEIRDLVELGVDVSPLREEAEAALAQVRAGHPERSAPHIARLYSKAISLADDLLSSPAAAAPASPSAAEALRRVTDRADRTRAGLPPTRLPASGVLREELERVLSGFRSVAPEGAAGPSTAPGLLETPTGAGTRPTGEPEALVHVPGSSASAGAPDRPPQPSAAGPPPERTGPAWPERRGPPRVIPEPPPLPTPPPLLSEPVRPAPAPALSEAPRKRSSEPATTVERVPPLPAPLPPPSSEEPVATPASPAVKATTRRRRRTTKAPAAEPLAGAAVAPAGGAVSPTTAKPRRRVVRRKKAPTVVAATAEPLPPASDGPGASPAAGTGDR